MTKEIYEARIKEIESNALLLRKQLYKEFASANNPYKIGDIVASNIAIIKIEKIQIVVNGLKYPQCLYTGVELTKKGEPNKRGLKMSIHQSSIKTN